MSYDTIIVGSGVGGMTTALILAKEGQKVLVLEQHVRPGGLMQTFRRKGLTFPTGVHCLGSLDEGQTLWRYFKYIGVLDRLQLVPMDPEGFTEFCFEKKCYRVPCGKQAFRERLIEYFDSENAVDRFITDMDHVVAGFPLYNVASAVQHRASNVQQISLQTYLETLTDNRHLRAVLSAIWPLYGLLPSECPLYIHFLVLDSFLNSSYRINESQTPLAKAFVDQLEDLGGEIRCGSEVVTIDCTNGVTKGVQLAGGEFMLSKTVVFAGHPKSILSLCSAGSLRPLFRHRLEMMPETDGIFGVALAWPNKQCPMANHDILLHSSLDFPTNVSPQLMGTSDMPTALYCSATPGDFKGSRAVTVMCAMNCQEMRKWETTMTGSRPSEYIDAKTDLGQRILSIIRDHWPNITADAKIIDIWPAPQNLIHQL